MDSINEKDQAETIRTLKSDPSRSDRRLTRVISITSGKGGVGKTSIVANLAYIISRLGKNVFVLDADIGLANVDVMLGLTPKYNIQHVLMGEKKLSDIVVDGPGNVKILPASSGVQELSELTYEQKLNILSDFNSLEEKIDFLFVYNMLLTGFDAKRLKKLYLGRIIRKHNLLQALTLSLIHI